MTECLRIAPLLADVADGAAQPAEVISVHRHVEECPRCRIELARERRLSSAIATMTEAAVGAGFTAGVMERIPAAPPRRERDRRGLRLVVLGLLVGFGAALLRSLPGPLSAGLGSPAAPGAPPDVVDPAARGLFSLAQTILMALQTLADAPWISAALGGAPAATGIALVLGAMFVAALACCGLALVTGVLMRAARPAL